MDMQEGEQQLQALQQLVLVEDEEEIEDVMAVVIRHRLQRARHRRFWVKPWLTRRRIHGQYHTLFQELD